MSSAPAMETASRTSSPHQHGITLGGEYVLVERGTDLARFDRNPYYWKIDVEGNQLPYLDGLDVEIVQDTEVTAGKIIAGEATLSGMPWVNGGLANYGAPPGARQ